MQSGNKKQKLKISETENRTRIWTVRATCDSHYTISDSTFLVNGRTEGNKILFLIT